MEVGCQIAILKFALSLSHKLTQMDKRIHTLIFIYVIYLAIALTMVFSTTGQKMLTMMLFGGGGALILLIYYFIWQQSRVKE